MKYRYQVIFYVLFFINLKSFVFAREQSFLPVKNVIVGEETTLSCAQVDTSQYLQWKFVKNGTDFIQNIAQVFPGNLPSVFGDFNIPAGRSKIELGNLVITDIFLQDEGHYWCEISSVNAQTVYSDKLPLHVWQRPEPPTVTSLGTKTIDEYIDTVVARCFSKNGKPESLLTWYNGSTPLHAPNVDPVVVKSTFNDELKDVSLDLKIINPTRFDNGREFLCKIDHPAYDKPIYLNHTINVRYHPVNIKMWANTTTKQVFCRADGFPEPKYAWTLPANIAISDQSYTEIYLNELLDLPGNQFFICEAYNELQPNATIRMTVDDLIYPDGKPGLLGLDWWVWGAIIGGIVAFIAIIIIIVCCKRRSKKAKGGTLQTKYTKGESKKPIAITRTNDYEEQYNQSLRNREDSFDDDVSPGPNTGRRFMDDDTYRDNVTLVPTQNVRASRENLSSHNRANSCENLGASREQLNDVADHITTLNKSWDYLSRSREELNNVQSELQQNQNDVYRSHERLDQRNSIPYMDDHQDNSYEDQYNTGNYSNNDYPEKQPIDDQYVDDRYKTYNAPPRYTEDPQQNHNNDQYQGDQQQGYDDNSYDRGYDRGQAGYDEHDGYQDQGYDDQGRHNDQSYNSNSYNYHPARIV